VQDGSYPQLASFGLYMSVDRLMI